MKNIAVFFGGESVEHDVSIITGVMTVNSIDREKYNAIPVYVYNDGTWYSGESLRDLDGYKDLNLKTLKKVTLVGGENVLYAVKGKKLKPLCTIAVAINCMHGERGEDGSLAGLLALHKIPLASPSILASAVCMDKAFTKTVLKGVGVKTLPYVYANCDESIKNVEKKFDFPVIVKPNKLGSSIGISVAKNPEQLKEAYNYATKFGEGAIIEPCLDGFTEINCAAYRDEKGEIIVSECEKPIGRTEILSFKDKYEGGNRVFPADIDIKLSNKIKELTKKIYREIFVCGVVRVDYFIKDGVVYLNEINTVPGSLSYYLFGETLKDFTKMLNQLISVSEKEFARRMTEQTEYESGILKGVGSKGAKHL